MNEDYLDNEGPPEGFACLSCHNRHEIESLDDYNPLKNYNVDFVDDEDALSKEDEDQERYENYLRNNWL